MPIKDLVFALISKIEKEPLESQEPMASVQIGRLQVVDELRAILRDDEENE
jgi:hypothetical protein